MLSTSAGEIGGAWQTWTPTFSGNGSMTISGTPSLLEAKYIRVGKIIYYNLNAQGKTIGGTPSTEVFFTAPVPRLSTGTNAHCGSGRVDNAASESAHVFWSGVDQGKIAVSRPTKANFVAGGLNLMVSGFYEAA